MQPSSDRALSVPRPTLILIRGLPGSGKSYLAGRLQHALGEESVVLLDPDAIDFTSDEYLAHVEAQTREGVDPALFPYRFSRAKAYQGIEDGKIIIWNQPFTNLDIFQKMVDRLLTHAAEHHTKLPILVVEVQTDPFIAQERIAQRKHAGGHGPSETTFARFVNEYGTAAARGYQVVTVQGQDDVHVSVAKVLDALSEVR